MKTILLSALAVIAACATHEVTAVDYTISGEQVLYNVGSASNSLLMSVPFALTQVGTNWTISSSYTNSGAKETLALVDGLSYNVTWDLAGTVSVALVTDDHMAFLEGAVSFPRVLLMAFLTTERRLDQVTNGPVPFLGPRHAGLHAYRWSIRWRADPPFLADEVRFVLDPGLAKRVPADQVRYYFRSGHRDWGLFRDFQESQRDGAAYSVTAWTNWNGSVLPLRCSFRFVTYDIANEGLVVPQLLVVTVTNIAQPASVSLVPALVPGSDVQLAVKGNCHSYRSIDGAFLSEEQAKVVGRVLRPRPAPTWMTTLYYVRSLPWASLGVLALLALTLLVALPAVWFVVRLFARR